MLSKAIIYCLILQSVLFRSSFVTTVYAQEKQTYKGKYTLRNGISGNAVFQYTTSGSDTIQNGTFEFEAATIDSSRGNFFNSIQYKGAYDFGLKSGKWNYSAKSLMPFNKFIERDYELIYQSTGKEFIANGNFIDGLASGNWEIIEQNILNSSPSDTLFYIKANFHKGTLRGKFEGISNKTVFTGSINDAGYVDGTWRITHQTSELGRVEESRHFKNGVLINHVIDFDLGSIAIKYVGLDQEINDDEVWERVNFNSRYFDIIKSAGVGAAYTGLSEAVIDTKGDFNVNQITDATNKLMEEVLSSFNKSGETQYWTLIRGSELIKPVYARLRKFPLSQDEKQNLEEASRLLSESKDIFKAIFENPTVELDRHANKRLMFYYEFLKIYQARTSRLADLVSQFSNPAFEYINREEIFDYLFSGMQYPESVKYEFKDTTFTEIVEFPKILIDQRGNANLAMRHLKSILTEITKIESAIDIILESRIKEAKLIEKEKALVVKRDSVTSLFNSDIGEEEANPYLLMISNKVQSVTLLAFKDYASLDLEQKVESIDELMQCFDAFIRLHNSHADIPRKLTRLNELYTRTVWNPYTMTDMNERVKERVYNAFESHLLPYYFNDIQASINCSEIGTKYNNFEMIYKRMVELRERDTKDIERELRAISSPERILRILSINLGDN